MKKLATIAPVALLAALAGCTGPTAGDAAENLGEADQASTAEGSWVSMPVPSSAGDVHCAYTSGGNTNWIYLKLQQIGSSSVEVYVVQFYVWTGSTREYYTVSMPQHTVSVGDTWSFTDSSDSYFQLVAGTDAHGDMTLAIQNGYFSYDGAMVECAAHVVSPTASASGAGVLGEPWIGSTLTGYYSFSDTEGLSESGSTFQWYRVSNGTATAISGATSESYVVTSADLMDQLEFCVTPSDSNGSGAQVCSSPTTMSAGYSAQAGACTFSGNPWVGSTITGTCGASDEDHLQITSTAYQWYTVSGGTQTAIAGATSASFTPTFAQINENISLCTTPSDAFGPGETMCSSNMLVPGVVWFSGQSQSGADVGESYANGTCVNVSSLDLGFTPASLALYGQSSAATNIYMYEGSNCSGTEFSRSAGAGTVHDINLSTVGIGSNLVSYKITW